MNKKAELAQLKKNIFWHLSWSRAVYVTVIALLCEIVAVKN
jgi:hypothetical protein